MGNITTLKLDFNGDITDVLSMLTSILPSTGEITERMTAFSACFTWHASGYDNLEIQLHEARIWDEGSPYSTHRFQVFLDGWGEFECLSDLFALLAAENKVPIEIGEHPSIHHAAHYPANFKPDFTVVTRNMPAVVMIRTPLSDRALKVEIRKLAGIRNWDVHEPTELRYEFSPIMSWDLQDGVLDHYGGFEATHRIRVFGLHPDPRERRLRRDAFARDLFEKIEPSPDLEARLFEVANGMVLPFGTST